MRSKIATGLLSTAAVTGLAAGAFLAGPLAPAMAASAGPAAVRPDAGMPRYYVITSESGPAALQVRSSATGHVVSSVAAPAACDPKGLRVTAAADDRTFVVGCDTPQSTSESNAFYRLRITDRGRASALRPLAIRTPADDALNDVALTPDGRRLAIGLQQFGGDPNGPGQLMVVTLATGRVRTWTGGQPFDLSWARHGTELGFFGSDGLYGLNVNAAGSKLSSARLLLSRTFKSDSVEEAKLSPDGTTIVASVIASNLPVSLKRGSVTGGVVDISARTGQARTVLAEHAHYSPDAGWFATSCLLGPIDASGHHLLLGCDHFGRLDRNQFTALPGVPQDDYFSAAW